MIQKFFRFELAFDGEPQDVGFLQGLVDAGLGSILTDDLYSLFDTLPHCGLDVYEPVSFWFTENGLEQFTDAINRVADELSSVNWQLLGATTETDLEYAVYKDAFQAAFLREDVMLGQSEYVEVRDVDEFKSSV